MCKRIVSHTYCLSRLQVRSLRAASDFKLLQALPAAGLRGASASPCRDGSLLAVGAGEIWQLRPVPLLEQVQQRRSAASCRMSRCVVGVASKVMYLPRRMSGRRCNVNVAGAGAGGAGQIRGGAGHLLPLLGPGARPHAAFPRGNPARV